MSLEGLLEKYKNSWHLSDQIDTQTLKDCLQLVTSDECYTLLKSPISHSQTAFHLAASCGHIETIKCLLDHLTSDQRISLLNAHDSLGDTAIHAAAGSGETETIRCALGYLSPENQILLINRSDFLGLTPQAVAVRQGRTETADYLHNLKLKAEDQLQQMRDKGRDKE